MLSKYFVKKVRTKNFDDHLKELFTELEDKKILLYGAGEGFEYLLDKYPFKDLNIVAIADKEFTQETVFKGMKAISPDAIIHQSYDIVLITYEYAPSIIMHLQDDLKIEDKKIKIIFKNSIPEERESFLYLEKYNFKKRLNKLNNKLKNKKIVIYGGGVFFQALKEYYDLSNLNIIGIADIKFENHLDGEKFLGYPVLAPNEIKGVNPDYVLVATKFFDRLIEKLRYETLNETKIKIRSLISESFLTLLKEVFFLRKNKTKGRYVPQKYKSKKDLPTKFRIEASSICQLKCKECYMRAMDKTKAPGCGYGYLKFKDYKNFIDKNVVTSVELSDNGEIFLNPELLDIVKYSYKKNVKLTAENGVNFNDVTDEMLEALVKYNFEFLAISLDGASQETYVQYRVGGDFNKIIDNIKKVNFYKEKYNSEYPTLSWKFILFGHNEHEITKARMMASNLKMPIFFAKNWSPAFSPLNNIKKIKEQIPNFFDESPSSPIDLGYNPCRQLWDSPQINWDGRLLGCCVPADFDFEVNVFKTELLQALNSRDYLATKQLVCGQKVNNITNACITCSYYKQMKNNNKWMK